jgi:hypothetical protein
MKKASCLELQLLEKIIKPHHPMNHLEEFELCNNTNGDASKA